MTDKHYHHAIGKVIKAARLTDEDKLVLTFEDASTLTASDEAQCCCEARYMRTDDNLHDLAGCRLLDFENKEAPTI